MMSRITLWQRMWKQKKTLPTDYKRQKVHSTNWIKFGGSSNIGEKTKIRLYQSNILSVLLYCAECWRLTQKDSQRLSGFRTKCLRKICKIYWPRKITNKRPVCKNRTEVIKQRQFRWLGLVFRKGNQSITKTALKRQRQKKPRKT